MSTIFYLCSDVIFLVLAKGLKPANFDFVKIGHTKSSIIGRELWFLSKCYNSEVKPFERNQNSLAIIELFL